MRGRDGQRDAIRLGKRVCRNFADLGPGLESVCKECGTAKPRMDEEWPACTGRAVLDLEDMANRRAKSIPCLLLAWAWTRMLAENGDEIDPSVIKGNKAGARVPFAGLNESITKDQFLLAGEHSKKIFSAVASSVDPQTHCLAVATMILMLTEAQEVDWNSHAALTATALLQEAEDGESWWAVRRQHVGELAETMVKEAQSLGYYGGKIRAFVR